MITHVAVPRNLTDDQVELFQSLSKTLGKEVIHKRDKSILGQLKAALGDFFGA